MKMSELRIDLNELNDRGQLMTEQANNLSIQLDQMATADLVRLFIKEDRKPQEAVAAAAKAITAAIEAVAERLENGGRLFYLGAGTSGRLGVLDAVECPPTFCTDPEMVQGVLAGGAESLIRSSEGIEDHSFEGQLDLEKRGFSSNDCLVGIAAGGTTPYVYGGLSYAKSIGALSIAIACVPKNQAALPCEIDIRLLTGPEIIAGSTRLKAGTATKMTLNILSTGVMVRLGKVYKNRMIDMVASNEKLMDRSIRILIDLAGIERDLALRLLQEAGGSLKVALLMANTSLSANEARRCLVENGQKLRSALEFN